MYHNTSLLGVTVQSTLQDKSCKVMKSYPVTWNKPAQIFLFSILTSWQTLSLNLLINSHSESHPNTQKFDYNYE